MLELNGFSLILNAFSLSHTQTFRRHWTGSHFDARQLDAQDLALTRSFGFETMPPI